MRVSLRAEVWSISRCAFGYRGDRCDEIDPCYNAPCGEALCVELKPAEVGAFNETYACVCKLTQDVTPGISKSPIYLIMF